MVPVSATTYIISVANMQIFMFRHRYMHRIHGSHWGCQPIHCCGILCVIGNLFYCLILVLIFGSYEAYCIFCFFSLMVTFVQSSQHCDVGRLLEKKPKLVHPFPLCFLPRITLGKYVFIFDINLFYLLFLSYYHVQLHLVLFGKKNYLCFFQQEILAKLLSTYFAICVHQTMSFPHLSVAILFWYWCLWRANHFQSWQWIFMVNNNRKYFDYCILFIFHCLVNNLTAQDIFVLSCIVLHGR